MFEDLKRNLKQEKKIVEDMHSIEVGMQNDVGNKDFYVSSLRSLVEQLALLNNAVPELLKEWSPVMEQRGVAGVDSKKDAKKVVVPKKRVVRMSYVSPSTKEKKYVVINKEDRKEFLSKLKLSEDSLDRIKEIKKKDSGIVVSKPSAYVKFSNRFFRRYSEKMVSQFDSLEKDLKRANIRFLLSSYLSMAILSMVIAFLFGFVIFAVLLIFSLSNWTYFVLPFGFAGLALAAFYFYPASEANSVQKNISQELPFATIHMAAIASSDIEPTKIFNIIAMSGEYPNVGREIRKVITRIEVYGYDLVTSLKNVSLVTSNKRLSELFSGLATNISTGGGLKNYLEKKSENFLVDYRLERQQYAALAGTFMDVYISILIAAPLVLMMMFIVMNVSGLGMAGMSIMTLLVLSVFGIVIVNIIFIVILNAKQPKV